MASDNAAAVAKEVLETIGKGKKVSKRQIIRRHGYAQNTADNPKLVTSTQTYKDIVEPIVNRWQKEIGRIQTELESRKLSDEKYKELVDAIDKLNKQVQLATGGDTERTKVIILPAEVINKYQLNEPSPSAKPDSSG